MPHPTFHRSQSAMVPATETERAYRRAARALRDFHRSRSLDVILEEDHHMEDNAPTGATLKKKRAVLCLADLVQQEGGEGEEADGSETTVDSCSEEFVSPHEGSNNSNNNNNKEGCWGHFTADSPSPSEQQACTRRHTIPMPLPNKARTMRRFGRS